VPLFHSLLSIKIFEFQEYRPFLTWENFRNPMRGASQTVVQRAISSGLYFPLEDMFNSLIAASSPSTPKRLVHFCAGLCAGAINGLALNPAARVKVVVACS
jgi:hypothetical protein